MIRYRFCGKTLVVLNILHYLELHKKIINTKNEDYYNMFKKLKIQKVIYLIN